MKLYLFPPSARVLGIVALKNHLALDCEVQPIDLGRGDQLTPQYLALNPNKKMPTLERDEERGTLTRMVSPLYVTEI
jgi:glutathione S-transferase